MGYITAMLNKSDYGEGDNLKEDINGTLEILKKSPKKIIMVTVILALLAIYFTYNAGYHTGELIYNLLH